MSLILGCANHCCMFKVLLSPELRVWPCAVESLCWVIGRASAPSGILWGAGDSQGTVTWPEWWRQNYLGMLLGAGEQVRLWSRESSKPVNLFLRTAS